MFPKFCVLTSGLDFTIFEGARDGLVSIDWSVRSTQHWGRYMLRQNRHCEIRAASVALVEHVNTQSARSTDSRLGNDSTST